MTTAIATEIVPAGNCAADDPDVCSHQAAIDASCTASISQLATTSRCMAATSLWRRTFRRAAGEGDDSAAADSA